MAALASVAGGQQWRKYTGGAEPRNLGFHMAFLIAARLALKAEELKRVIEQMRGVGYGIQDLSPAP